MAQDLKVRTYDPKLIIVTFGVTPIFGFAEGTFLSVERNGDGFEKSKGADGTVDRINKNAFDGMITLTIKQTSLTNDALSAIFNADQLSNAGVFPMLVKDLNGLTLVSAPQAWIKKDPNMEYSDSLGTREWAFDTGPFAVLQGGNIL